MTILLSIIYLAFISLGLPGFSAGFSVASDAFGIGRGDFLCWNHYHDYFIWNDSFQPDERPIE